MSKKFVRVTDLQDPLRRSAVVSTETLAKIRKKDPKRKLRVTNK